MIGRRLLITCLVILAFTGAVSVGAWWLAEEAMSPTTAERRTMAEIFGGIGLASAFFAILLHGAVWHSLTRRIVFGAMVGPIVVAAATWAGASRLFESRHDLEVSLFLVGLAAVLGGGIALGLVGTVGSDLRRFGATVKAVGTGDRGARVGLDRPDELGELSSSFDSMVEQLSATEAERDSFEEERSIMMATLSHDLRTPLAAMRAALESVQDGISPDPTRYLDSMAKDLDAVESMVDDLFLLGRLDAGQLQLSPEPVDMVELIDGTVEALTPLAHRSDVDLVVKGCARADVEADISGLGRVLRNLVDNAIRHSPAGGKVRIDVATESAMADKAGGTVVHVLDEGPGFPEDFCVEAFERFRRADDARSGGGAGLGLAVAAGIIEGLGGRIWADPGPGGRVSFELPSLTMAP